MDQHLSLNRWWDWPLDLMFYILDLTLIPDAIDHLLSLLKPNVRPLNDLEFAIVNEVYGDHIDIDRIKIDSQARLLTKKYAFAYVSFNTINYWEQLSDEILIHEVMHIYQYQKYGSVYIYRALAAQKTAEGYDYGSFKGLEKAKSLGKSLKDFNFEQQASIIEDYYQITQRMDLIMVPGMVALYQYYRDQL